MLSHRTAQFAKTNNNILLSAASNIKHHDHRILAIFTVGTVRGSVTVISGTRRKVEYVTIQFFREEGRRL